MMLRSCLIALMVGSLAETKRLAPTSRGYYTSPYLQYPPHLAGHRYLHRPLHPAGHVYPGAYTHPGAPIHGVRPLPYGKLGYPAGLPGYLDPYHNTPAFYDFEHAVHDDLTGTHFGHSEVRDGYLTEGQYFVHLPDGRVQTVTYYADQTGYHPTINYDNDPYHKVAPAAVHPPAAVHAPGTPLPRYHAP
nr:pro-resilin-like [Cherax quadricarinatus]